MYQEITSNFIIILNVLQLPTVLARKELPLWSWDCIDEKCVPIKANENAILQSLTTCNMLCSSLQLWPQPTGAVTLSDTAAPVTAKLFYLNILSYPSEAVREHILLAFDLFLADLYKLETSITSNDCKSVEIRLLINESGSIDPRMLGDTDECYELKIYPSRSSVSLVADITSNSFCGARHALQTLLQMIWYDSYKGNLLMIDNAVIQDRPQFRYRGLMLDTASNYINLNAILRTIDAMAASKLNTFHWHTVDLNGISIKLKEQFDSYGFYDQSKKKYTVDDVHAVVRHATLRGIKVILTINLLAPVWQSESFTKWKQCYKKSCDNDLCNIIVSFMSNSNYYDFLEKTYAKTVNLTGLNEVLIDSSEYFELCNKYINTSKAIDMWSKCTRKFLEHIENSKRLLPDQIILCSTTITDHIKIDLKKYIHKLTILTRDVAWDRNYIAGLRTIISHKDVWDVNSGYGAWYESGSTPYNSWQRIYGHRPWTKRTCLEGGELSVWSSRLSDIDLDAHIWPRAAAFAERLWSDPAEGVSRRVNARLDVHRFRLLSLGIRSAPLWSMWCSHNPFTC